MKRLFCLLLAAALLLGGCTLTDTPEASEVETPTQSTEPSTQSAAALGSLNEPTAGGITVKTDYSGYSPRVAPEAKYTRLSEGPLLDLTPSEDYGAIYPYTGTPLYGIEPYSLGFQMGYLYGMVDENGRILTDPVYTSISLLSNYNFQEYSPFWLLARVGDDYGYETSNSFCALASLDGSFVTDCIYRSATGCGDVALATRQIDGETVLEVIDASGKLIYSSLEHPFERPLAPYAYEFSYSDGVLRLCAETGEYESYDYGNGELEYYPIYGYYFADLDGNLISGPYDSAGSFSSGYSTVQLSSGNYAFVDREGGYLANTEFLYAGNFIDGYACVDFATDGNGPYCIINTDCEIVNELEGTDTPIYYDGGYHTYDSYDTTGYIYDYRGELLYCDTPTTDGWKSVNQFVELFLPYDWNDADPGGSLRNKETGATYEFPRGYEFNYSFQPYVLLNRYGESHISKAYLLLDMDLNEISSGTGNLIQIEDNIADTSYIMNNSGSLRLYDMEMNELCVLPGAYRHLWIYNDRIMLVDNFSCSYYDLDGNLLFRYLLTDAAED